MKDYKQLFGYAAMMLSAGFLARSFQPAYAINGANISLGSNPIQSWSKSYQSTAGWLPVGTMTDDFVITDIFMYSKGSGCRLKLHKQSTGDVIFDAYVDQNKQSTTNLNGGIVVEAGETVEAYQIIDNVNYSLYHCSYLISGHYVHTP